MPGLMGYAETPAEREAIERDEYEAHRAAKEESADTFSLILSGKVTIVAGGDSDSVRIELTETQLRSLAYHAARAVEALSK